MGVIDYWPHALGYTVSVVLGHHAAKYILQTFYGLISEADRKQVFGVVPYTGHIVGYVESVIYTSSVLAGFHELAGIWLALKVAAQWQRWSDPKGRFFFNGFLVGAGISLTYGVLGARFIQWTYKGHFDLALLVTASLVLATILLKVSIERSRLNQRSVRT